MKPTSTHCAAALLLAMNLTAASPKIDKQPFGVMPDGTHVSVYTLKNAAGMEVKITNYGGAVTSIKAPDRNKKFGEVVLGFDSVEGYTAKANTSYFGALIGRYGNRLAGGTFRLNGKSYQVPKNEGPNSLHGGTVGFDKRVWEAKEVDGPEGPALELHYLSPDGEEGFPGNLHVTVRYTLDSKNGLHIDYSATTDKDTVLNLTNHSYFNLQGAGSKSMLTHKLMLDADHFTPVNATLIPTGAIESVAGTPFDFRKLTEVGSRIGQANEQLKLGKGYDHNFVLNHPGDLSALAAKVEEPGSGRVLEVFTDQPGLQFYTGNFLDGTNKGPGGVYGFRSALCMETQHFPDSPNHANFPSAVLRAGQKFHSTTIYRFSVE
ncbi:MAG TPA: aldose epimerase family protein [Bryobacteraceae bacterium]|nr:aldose epimerase family protein [Bryobacteraceae bacterium]